MNPPPTTSTLFPYTTLFRSDHDRGPAALRDIASADPSRGRPQRGHLEEDVRPGGGDRAQTPGFGAHEPRRAALGSRSEEHTSEPSHVKISYAVFCLKKKKKQ